MLRKICQILSLFVVSLFFVASPAEASILYFKPIGGTMKPNSVFPVEIRMHAIEPELITSTSVYFNYPQDKIEVSYVKAGSSFPINIGNTYGNGVFALTRQNTNGVTGDVLVATIGFKPKVVNTTAELQFVDGISLAQKDNSETLDMEWTKANLAKYNITDGKITYSAGTAQGGNIDTLPTAGLFDNTAIILGVGFGSILFGGVGIYGSKRFRTQKNTIS
jgi:hypothetical protein